MSGPKDQLGRIDISFEDLDEGWVDDDVEPGTVPYPQPTSGFFNKGPKELDLLSRFDDDEATLIIDLDPYLQMLEPPYAEIAAAVRARFKAFVKKCFDGEYDESEINAMYSDARLVREKLVTIKKAVDAD